MHPVVHAPRKCPIALCLKVKGHLNKMECLGVITHVDDPKDWVSSITYIQKANGKLCLCLDPRNFYEAICQDHHKMPMVGEVAHKFVHSCFFIKLDAHHGYWSFPATSFWLHLFPRHLPEDGPDPQRMQRMH